MEHAIHTTPADPLAGLLVRTKRRWMAVRAIEYGACGLAAGAVVSLAVSGLMWWLGESSLTLVGQIVVISTIIGACASVLRRPTAMAAARRLDEQHGLSDLLSTAWQLRTQRRQDHAMAATVGVLARAAAERVAGAGLPLWRWDARVYGLAVVLAAASLTVSAMASSSTRQAPGLSSTDTVDRPGLRADTAGRATRSAAGQSAMRAAPAAAARPVLPPAARDAGSGSAASDGTPARQDRAASSGAFASDSSAAQPPSFKAFPADRPSDPNASGFGTGNHARTDATAGGSAPRAAGSTDAPAARSSAAGATAGETDLRTGRRQGAEEYHDLIRAYFLRD